MSSKRSELYFENSDDVIQKSIVLAIQKVDPDFKFENLHLKKWRYSHPLENVEKLFVETSPRLFLAGDAFGRPSLNGAAASATAIANYMIAKNFLVI